MFDLYSKLYKKLQLHVIRPLILPFLPGKPSKPQGPLDVADVTKNGCTLSWKKPEDDGGTPIEYYEIEKLDPLTGMFILTVLIYKLSIRNLCTPIHTHK